MIYQALVELARREGLLEDTVYEPKEVHYLLVLNKSGDLLEIREPRDPQPLDRKGRAIGRPVPPKRPIPRRFRSTSGDRAEFLVHKADYVFGIDPTGKKDESKLSQRRRLFREAVEEAAAATPESSGLQAVIRFLKREPPTQVLQLLRAEKDAERSALSGALFAFMYQPDGGVACVHDEPAVKAFFGRKLEPQDDAPKGQCLVTGAGDAYLTRLHAKPKGIPPRGKTKGGVPLTSVNSDAFESYGLKDVGCAPISREANVGIELALNRLLDTNYPKPGGGSFARQALDISNDTAVLYWTREETDLSFLALLQDQDPEVVAELLRSPYKAHTPPIENATDFYALVISGDTGRATVRSFLHTTVSDVARALDRYRDEARIVRPYGQGPGGFPLMELRRTLVARGDLDLLPPALGTGLYVDILTGTPFPRAVLETAARRGRQHDFHEDRKRRDFRRLAPRCSLLKAYFNRNHKEGVTVSLDESRTDPPYRLGRLLAVIDKIQQESLGDVNATLVDRFYGSASTTPQAVFSTLLRRVHIHMGKLRREKPGLAIVRDRLIQQIVSGLPSFPPTLNLEAQGLFALGFYHQRQDLFTKKEQQDDSARQSI